MRDLSRLSHVEEPLPGGGCVLALDVGAEITAEDSAMLQALHSRSPAGIRSHLEKLAKTDSGKFMESFYVGYGHKSIGDCGSVTLFLEGISMLAAKALQDWALYSGQECSTRYLDFSRQPFMDPLGKPGSKKVLDALRAFYVESGEPVRASLRERFPLGTGEDEISYEKAIAARSFDILRAFLPAGAQTNASWHANLRQTADKISWMRHHPLAEVRALADAMRKACVRAWPHSFCAKSYEATENYVGSFMREDYLFDGVPGKKWPEFKLAFVGMDKKILKGYRSALASRPAKTELPKQLAEAGTARFEFLLDFGSYRDIQRHRAVSQRSPLVGVRHGFEPWYLGELPGTENDPSSVRGKARALLALVEAFHSSELKAGTPAADLQYCVPMGYRVANRVSGDLPALTYLAELRSTAFVHPTLQKRARQMAAALEKEFRKFGYASHADRGQEGRFDARRGSQDIVEKK